jgi:hypothetical protein
MSGCKLFAPNLPPNLCNAPLEKAHYRLDSFSPVVQHLHRYSATRKYYVVFKFGGKTKWMPLNTTDREIAGRKAKEEMAKFKKTDPAANTMTSENLLGLPERKTVGNGFPRTLTLKHPVETGCQFWRNGAQSPLSGKLPAGSTGSGKKTAATVVRWRLPIFSTNPSYLILRRSRNEEAPMTPRAIVLGSGTAVVV